MTSETNLITRLFSRATQISLQWQICILTGFAVLISLSVMGYVGFIHARDAVIEAKLELLSSQTAIATGSIERELKATSDDVLRTPLFPPIPGIVRCLDNDGNDPDPTQTGSTTEIWIQRLGTILTAQMQGRDQRIRATVVDKSGDELARVEHKNELTHVLYDQLDRFEPASFIKETLDTLPGVVTVSQVIVDPLTRQRSIHLGTPYADADNKVRGVFAITLNVDLIVKTAAAGIHSGETDVVDNAGRYLYCAEHPEYAFSTREYELDKPVRARLLKASSSTDDYRELVPGRERPDGVSMIAIYEKVFYAGDDRTRFWAVAPSIRADEALTDVTALGYSFLMLGTILIASVGTATFVASRGLTSSLRRLTRTADEIAQGDLDSEMPSDNPMGEVRSLRDALSTMTQNLRTTLAESNRQQKRTSAILNSTADGILSIDEDGSIRSINSAAANLFGVKGTDALGQNVSQFVPVLHDQDARYESTPLQESEVRPLGGESEVTGHHRDGSIIPLAMRVTEMEHAGERLYIATLQDIAERKRTEEERRKAEIQRKKSEQQRKRLFEGIRDAVRSLAASSSEILATTTQQATSAQQQAASVTETATTVEELTHTAEETSGRAKDVADSAAKADQVGQTGRQSVNATISAMHHVREQVESLADNIMALSERAKAIKGIIETVNDIADQTNLLALNAAIEASRAGEHGRGFAVVASEVKALADQSRKATLQVENILGEIQDATNTAVLATEQGTKSVSKAEHVITEADHTIETLSRTISDAAVSANQIVASTNQQATAMRQIRDAVNHIDIGTKQTLTATRQSEQSARDLNSLGDRLTKLIEQNDHDED